LKLQDIGEFGLIDRIAGKVRDKFSVPIGIGDDAAGIRPAEGTLTLVTSDMLIEGVHFDFNLTDPRSLGRKSLAVNLSDMAAMGCRPRYFLLSMGVPSHVSVDFLDAFIAGIMDRADQFAVGLIGGDTCSSKSGFVISITMMGEQLPEQTVRRSGAVPGDMICVTGTVGDSALGLQLLQRGEREGLPVLRHLDPVPRVAEGMALAEARLPSAMIDISDGLAADLGHILDQSGVGACVHLESIPLSEPFRCGCNSMDLDPFSLALAGGEDYELLFTVPPAQQHLVRELLTGTGSSVTVIGNITESRHLSIIAGDGSEYTLAAKGYDHFSGSASVPDRREAQQ